MVPRVALQPVEQELELEPGGLATTMVGVRNTGKTTWGSEGDEPVYLSYRWFVAKEDGSLDPLPIEGERTPLPRAVAPDETVVVRASVSVSAGRGRYILIWDMVHADKLWFSDKAGLGSPVRVLVGEEDGFSELPRPEDVRDRLAREAWRPGRWELWGLALTLFKDNPILGIGPDNFRWSYGPAAGRSTWDTRTFSNSLYLETLATTGLVGAVIFFSLVASALWGLRRVVVSSAESPVNSVALVALVVSCSLAGFLIHGVFDYLLESTSIYLAFWILLGSSAALIHVEATS